MTESIWEEYERRKKAICGIGLTPDEYEQEIQEIARALELRDRLAYRETRRANREVGNVTRT